MTTIPSQQTPSSAQSSRHYVDYDEYIDFQLRKTRGNIKLTDLLTAGAGAATLVLTYLLLFVVFDQWIVRGGFASLSRGLMLGGLAIATTLWLVWKIAIPYWKQVTALYAANVIEQTDPNLKSSLLNLIDLHRAGREIPQEVRAAMEKRAAVSLSQIDVNEAVDRRPLMRLSYTLLAVVIVCCLYTLFSPKKISSSIWRAFLPTANVSVATKTEILEVRPGDVELPAGSQLAVTVDLRGDTPDRVFLFYTTADHHDADEPVEMRLIDEVIHRYRGVITGDNGRGILQNLTYTIRAGDARTRDFQVTVLEPPSATIEQVRYAYPAYMEREPRTQPGGHLDAWEGTTVTIEAVTNMPVKTATLKFSDTSDLGVKAEEIRMDITGGTRLRAEWKLRFRSDGTYPRFYHIDCRNAKGEYDPSPTLYRIRILRDKPPTITLIDPTGDLEKPANATIPLLIRARDPDFKLRFISLRIEKQGQPLPWTEQIFDGDREGLRQSFQGTYDLPLERLGLKPGDVISFWLEARDNKQPAGNRTNTPKLQVRIITPVSPQEAARQHKRDKQRGEDKLAADDPDLNRDQTPKPKQRKEGQGDEPAGEGSGAKQKKPGDKPSKTKSKDGDKGRKTEPGDGQTPAQGTRAGNKRPRRDAPASDEEALRKLLQREQQGRRNSDGSGSKPPKDKDQDKKGKNATPKQKRPDGTPPSGKPMPMADPKRPTDSTGQKPKSPDKTTADGGDKKPQPDGNKPDGDKGADKKTGGKTGTTKKDDGKDGGKGGSKGKQGGSTGSPQPKKGADDGTGGKKSGGKGTPSDPRSSDKNRTPGAGTKPAKTKPDGGGKPSTKPSTKPATGAETPAPDTPNAKKQKATGNETGTGTPDRDPKSDPTRAKNNIRRKDGTKPAVRDSKSKTGDPASRMDKSGRGAADAGKGKPAPKRRPTTKGGSPDKPTSSTAKPDGKRPPAATQGDKKPEGGDTLKSRNVAKRTNPKSSSGGKAGSGQQNDKGRKGSNQTGPGDSSKKKGSNEPAGSKQKGTSGKSKGGSSKSKAGKSGKSKSGGGKSGSSKSGGGKSGSSKGKGGKGGKGGMGAGKTSKAGKPTGRSSGGGGAAKGRSGDGGGTPGGRVGPGKRAGQAAGGSEPTDDAEEANLEYSRKAAALVLKRLQDELNRGEISPQLLKELGWTKADMQRFAQRLQRQLRDAGDDTSPEAAARRRQFEETLKSLTLSTRRGTRAGAKVRNRTQGAAVGSRRTPVPPEYRNAVDAYTRSLSRQKTGSNK